MQLQRATISVQSIDNACFAWAVVAALYPAERHADRQSLYPHYTSVLNLQHIDFPMSLNHITRFERLNNISINVYSFEEKRAEKGAKFTIFPIRLTDFNKDNNKHINLLYIQEQSDNNVRHFAWIKNLSRLVSMQLSKHKAKKFICGRCLHFFNSCEKLEIHMIDCRKINDSAILLPSDDDKWVSFKNYRRKERLLFVVYVDLECILKKMEDKNQEGWKMGCGSNDCKTKFSFS